MAKCNQLTPLPVTGLKPNPKKIEKISKSILAHPVAMSRAIVGFESTFVVRVNIIRSCGTPGAGGVL